MRRDAKAALLAEWRQAVRHAPPAVRLAWLESAAGLLVFGARQRVQLAKQVKALRKRLESECPGGAWIDAGWHGGAAFPPMPEERDGGARCGSDGRKLLWMEQPWQPICVEQAAAIACVDADAFRRLMTRALSSGRSEFTVADRTYRAVTGRARQGMVRGRVGVRYGDGLPQRRWTPQDAVSLEDRLDAMSALDALRYDGPPSPSAIAIWRIGVWRGRPVRQRLRSVARRRLPELAGGKSASNAAKIRASRERTLAYAGHRLLVVAES